MKTLIIKNSHFITFIIILLLGVTGFSQNSTKLKQREAALKKQIDETKSLLEASKKSQEATIAELSILNNQISYREALANNLNSQISQIETDIEKNITEIENLEKELGKLKAEFKEMVRFAYKQRNKDYNILYILSSKDLNEAYRRMKYINQYAENRRLQAKEVVNTQEKLTSQNEQLKKNKAEKIVVVDEAQKAKEELLVDKTQQQETLNKINSNQSSLQQKLTQQQKEKDQIAQAIRDAIAKELKAEAEAKEKARKEAEKNKTTAKTNTSTKPVIEDTPKEEIVGDQFGQNKGKLPWPVDKGTIVSQFGRQQHSVVSTTYIENNGIDISTTKSASVRAVFEGKVSSVISIPGSGKAVIISHGDYRTVYANLESVSVSVGQKISVKETLGVLLPDASGTLSQSHFEVWQVSGSNMQPVNPSYWLMKR